MESNSELKIDMLIASRILKAAWNYVKSETIRKYFAKAGSQFTIKTSVNII